MNCYGPEGGHEIHAFDFSQRGIAALRLLSGDDGGTWGRAAFDDGIVSKERGLLNLRVPLSLGDSPAFGFASLLSCSARESVVD